MRVLRFRVMEELGEKEGNGSRTNKEGGVAKKVMVAPRGREMPIELGEGGAMTKQGERGGGVMALKLEVRGNNGRRKKEGGDNNKIRREGRQW
jgi:hypothetical protein